jgi:hypothetical protein
VIGKECRLVLLNKITEEKSFSDNLHSFLPLAHSVS